MKFPFKTKEKVLSKIIADPSAEESQWLPACHAVGDKELVKPVPSADSESESGSKSFSLSSFLKMNATALCIITGQIFLISNSADFCGNLAALWFGQSYERVMYHCGPQDTLCGVFTVVAFPMFWSGWCYPKRRFLKLFFLLAIALPVSILLAFNLSAAVGVLFGLLSMGLFAFLQYAGTQLASFRKSLPRKFSATKWAAICFIPAGLMFLKEFAEVDPNGTVADHPEPLSLLMNVGIIAACVFLPCFLTSVFSGTRRFASALGLTSVVQVPVLLSVWLYCLCNVAMLCAASFFGAQALADYFAKNGPAVLNPDFDLSPNNFTELSAKLISSLMVFAAMTFSVWAGTALGVLWNRKHKKHHRVSSS